jgi:hypothetical protein
MQCAGKAVATTQALAHTTTVAVTSLHWPNAVPMQQQEAAYSQWRRVLTLACLRHSLSVDASTSSHMLGSIVFTEALHEALTVVTVIILQLRKPLPCMCVTLC